MPKNKEPMPRIDWNRMWQDHYATPPQQRDDLGFWNDFAPRFRKKTGGVAADPYIETFYEYSGFLPGETIFDMGCASGTLAIPYAQRGHEIYAADFSPEMLKYLMIGAEEAGVADRIHPIRLDWNEDWHKREDLPVCDVAISSRSLIAWDLTKAMQDLESVARRKVCLGVWDTPAWGYDREIAALLEYERPGYGCYVYVMNELMDRDLLPELRFIRSPFRLTKYPSYEEALQTQIRSFQYGLTDVQMQRLVQYCRDHLQEHQEADRTYWKFDHSEESTIAHVSWLVQGQSQEDQNAG